MGRNNNRSNGAPRRDGRGSSFHGEHSKVRYGSFTQEVQSHNSISKIRRAGDADTLTYAQMKQVDLSSALSNMCGKMVFNSVFGKTTSEQEDKQQNVDPEYTPLKPKVYNPDATMENFENLRLFGSAIHVGDKCGVIAPKGVGKSGLMMQVGNAIAEGVSTELWPGFEDGINRPQRVLYYDGELTDPDMFNRYYRYSFEFNDNFERYDQTQFRSANDIISDLIWKVENEMSAEDYVTVFFDNITKILKTEQVSEVNNFLEAIDSVYDKAQKKGIKLTVIYIIHVLAKEYVPGSPINLKIAAGGSNLTNFLNSVIAIEQPKYAGNIILVKVLNSRGEPEPDNVCVLRRVGKDEGTHYHFEYVGEMPEKEALQGRVDGDEEEEPKEDGRGKRWTDEDTARLIELASTLETPDKDHIAEVMGRTPDMIYKMARQNGIKLMPKSRGRKPKQKPDLDEQ